MCFCLKQHKLFELYQNLYFVGQNVLSRPHVYLCVKHTSIVSFWWSESTCKFHLLITSIAYGVAGIRASIVMEINL